MRLTTSYTSSAKKGARKQRLDADAKTNNAMDIGSVNDQPYSEQWGNEGWGYSDYHCSTYGGYGGSPGESNLSDAPEQEGGEESGIAGETGHKKKN